MPGFDLDIGSGADLTRATRAYRPLLPCAARGDIQWPLPVKNRRRGINHAISFGGKAAASARNAWTIRSRSASVGANR
jgi:hypothetical protein